MLGRKESDKMDTTKKNTLIRMGLYVAAGSVLALLLMFPARGVMNAVSRLDYISQRLDDYPRMYAGYEQEMNGLEDWWRKEAYEERAKQAAYIYDADKAHSSEEEKLAHIAKMLGAVSAVICAPGEEAAAADAQTGPVVWEQLKDGRMIVLSYSEDAQAGRSTLEEGDSYFLSQVEAGLPGYICVVRGGELSVYPRKDNEEALKNMIRSMIESGAIDQEELVEKAQRSGKKTALKLMLNPGSGEVPARKYLVSSAAYTDNEDMVINISSLSDLLRLARKRSWALWFLTTSIMIILALSIWRTKLYVPGTGPEGEQITAVKRSISVMFAAAVLIFGSVFMIQLLSGVNLAQQGATDQAVYLMEILDHEGMRASNIEKEFDDLYLSRARTASQLLSENPDLLDTDSLYSLDHLLQGSGLKVFNAEGELIASDELLHNAVDTGRISTADQLSEEPQASGSGSGSLSGESDSIVRRYRAVMENDRGRTIGWVELSALQSRLEDLLADSRFEEVIGDLHLLDTMHVVAVDKTSEGRIAASNTWKDWVGDLALDHRINTELLFGGYEGIVNFDGNKCYSVVFSYGDYYVIVGSENESAMVFIGGTIILSLLLSIVTMAVVYRPLVKQILTYQKKDFEEDPEGNINEERNDFPALKEYFRDFMIAVFMLTVVLYFSTRGNPAGLTYNIVRGTWIHGVNAATVTTCIMLASVLVTVGRLFEILLEQLGRYLSPRDITFCRLMSSVLSYLGPIALIIYALAMFGVNTTTLIGGVGATALIFTLGANSLIADVLAGIFIIIEDDCVVGDVIVIDDFRGIVTDITMRTIKLMDENSRDVRIINNSAIKSMTNQSKENSVVYVDIPISHTVGLERGERILKKAITKLPAMYPGIIGTPQYWGVSVLPEKHPVTGLLYGLKARIAFECMERDKVMLTYQVYRSLAELVNDLNTDPPAEITEGNT